jgi:CubicO group peptidase (beta-lactamase class C family)
MKRYLVLLVAVVGLLTGAIVVGVLTDAAEELEAKVDQIVEPGDLKARVDQIVEPHLRDAKGVGIVVGVLTDDGRQVFGYGTVRLKEERQPDGDTLFEIGSVTKVFTTLILADMVRVGEVRLDDPVQLYLPETVKVPKRGDKEITLRHLATHTSGLPRLPWSSWHQLLNLNNDNPYAHYSTEEVYRFVSGQELQRDPGAKYEYSNLGVGLLGDALVRRAKAKNYEELVVKRVCEPLGLKDTHITLSDGQKERLAPGHDEKGKPTPGWDFASIEGAGALRSTTNDLLTFLEAQLGRKKTDLQPAIESCQKVYHEEANGKRRIGLGWRMADLNGKTLAGHMGGTGGYRSSVLFLKGGKTGVVVLCNSAKIGEKVEEIGVEVLKEVDAKQE